MPTPLQILMDPISLTVIALHHSAERLDTSGAFWFSPLDIVGWTALSSLCLAVTVPTDSIARHHYYL